MKKYDINGLETIICSYWFTRMNKHEEQTRLLSKSTLSPLGNPKIDYYSGFTIFCSPPETIYFATSAQQVSLSAFSSGISRENSSSKAMTSSTLSKLSRDKSFWKSAAAVTCFRDQMKSTLLFWPMCNGQSDCLLKLSKKPLCFDIKCHLTIRLIVHVNLIKWRVKVRRPFEKNHKIDRKQKKQRKLQGSRQVVTLLASILSNFLTSPMTRSMIWSGLIPADVHICQRSCLNTFPLWANSNCSAEPLSPMWLKMEFLTLCIFRQAGNQHKSLKSECANQIT